MVVQLEVLSVNHDISGAFPSPFWLAATILKSIQSMITVALMLLLYQYYSLELGRLRVKNPLLSYMSLRSSTKLLTFLFEIIMIGFHIPPFADVLIRDVNNVSRTWCAGVDFCQEVLLLIRVLIRRETMRRCTLT